MGSTQGPGGIIREHGRGTDRQRLRAVAVNLSTYAVSGCAPRGCGRVSIDCTRASMHDAHTHPCKRRQRARAVAGVSGHHRCDTALIHNVVKSSHARNRGS